MNFLPIDRREGSVCITFNRGGGDQAGAVRSLQRDAAGYFMTSSVIEDQISIHLNSFALGVSGLFLLEIISWNISACICDDARMALS